MEAGWVGLVEGKERDGVALYSGLGGELGLGFGGIFWWECEVGLGLVGFD